MLFFSIFLLYLFYAILKNAHDDFILNFLSPSIVYSKITMRMYFFGLSYF
jgi:hypothetical protein